MKKKTNAKDATPLIYTYYIMLKENHSFQIHVGIHMYFAENMMKHSIKQIYIYIYVVHNMFNEKYMLKRPIYLPINNVNTTWQEDRIRE